MAIKIASFWSLEMFVKMEMEMEVEMAANGPIETRQIFI